jgi:hypothetical protein
MNKIIISVLGTAIMFGCSTTNKEIFNRSGTLVPKPILKSEIEKKGTPSWVSTGSGVSMSDNHESKDAFFGVGEKKYIESPDKVQMDADDAARNSLIRVLGDFNKGFTLIELMTLSSYIAAGIHGEC